MMYQTLLKNLRKEVTDEVVNIQPVIDPKKPSGFIRREQVTTPDQPKYEPLKFVREGVAHINQTRKKFKNTLREIQAKESRAARGNTGFLAGLKKSQEMQDSGQDDKETLVSDKAPVPMVGDEPLRGPSGGTGDIAAAASAIKQIESGDNYAARGPVIQSGRYKGERAMGAYQVMPGNLPQWSKEALGREVSEQEFMESPEIQDKIFEHFFNKSYKRHGTWQDAASVWFSGQPLSRAGERSDGYNTVPQYVGKFNTQFNKFRG